MVEGFFWWSQRAQVESSEPRQFEADKASMLSAQAFMRFRVRRGRNVFTDFDRVYVLDIGSHILGGGWGMLGPFFFFLGGGGGGGGGGLRFLGRPPG